MSKQSFSPLRYRQIHLDFHTSESIHDIGRDFDADGFADQLAAAHVDSVTLFARCHHGWTYYPSEIGPSHPHLARPDLLGDMVAACRARDIETPVYITVQWDEYLARRRPEWRVMSAVNRSQHDSTDASASRQLTPTWHSLCLSHSEFRDYILATAKEVANRYQPPGLFFDIVTSFQCVCPNCIDRMVAAGRDPENAQDRMQNDQELADEFRTFMSGALWDEFPALRVFYNAGHIPKKSRAQFDTYSHVEIESLPTGGWGYDHFPSSARYAVPAGLDVLGQTGKFHTLWGEFGGFKSAEALEYECAQMVALGTKCQIGDQLHPNGVINADTYGRIAPAFGRIKALEPYLRGAEQISEIGILSVEHFGTPTERRNAQSDDGAVQMLLELKIPFDMLDSQSDFGRYGLLILPDDIPVPAEIETRLLDYMARGGKIIASGLSGNWGNGALGMADLGHDHGFEPTYLSAPNMAASIPNSPVVVYGAARAVAARGGTVLADAIRPIDNRSWRAFSSHQHFPDDPDAPPLGPGVVVTDATAYVAWPIFGIYKRAGQPIYKALIAALIQRLLPRPGIVTDLPSGARLSVTRQETARRTIVHLLFGGPQVRGVAVDDLQHGQRHIEVIEDIPHLGPVAVKLACDAKPSAVKLVPQNTPIDWEWRDGYCCFTLPGLHIHQAVAIEDSP